MTDPVQEWLDQIDGELLPADVRECPACDGAPCVWTTNVYPLPARIEP